jgi:hypothetical protein
MKYVTTQIVTNIFFNSPGMVNLSKYLMVAETELGSSYLFSH